MGKKLEEQMGSFCIWDKSHSLNKVDMDPNYLSRMMMPNSSFHQALHLFQLMNNGTPIMHVDVHGKLTRSDGYELDVGISCLQQHWNCKQYQEGYFTEAFEYQLKKQFDEILLKHVTPSKGFDASTNTNPYLCGNWGNVDCATMTEQAIHLGIPSFQLEIPPPMRKEIFYSEALCKKMA